MAFRDDVYNRAGGKCECKMKTCDHSGRCPAMLRGEWEIHRITAGGPYRLATLWQCARGVIGTPLVTAPENAKFSYNSLRTASTSEAVLGINSMVIFNRHFRKKCLASIYINHVISLLFMILITGILKIAGRMHGFAFWETNALTVNNV